MDFKKSIFLYGYAPVIRYICEYMTRPVPLGFFINKFPLWDGAGLWPIKVSQACPTG